MKISVYYLHNFGLPLEDCKNLSTFDISLIDIFFSSKIIRSLPDNVNESFLLAKLTVLEHKIKISSKLFSAIEILLPFNLKAQTLKECKRLKINYVPSEMHQMIENFHIVHKKIISPQSFENYQNAMKSYKYYHYNEHYQQEFLEIKLLELINDDINDIDLIVNALFEDNKINKQNSTD